MGTSVHAAGLVLEEVHVLARADEPCVVPQDLGLLAAPEVEVVAEEVVGDEVLCEVGLWDAASRARLEAGSVHVTFVEALSLAGVEVAVCRVHADLRDEAAEDGLLHALAVIEGPEVVADHVLVSS